MTEVKAADAAGGGTPEATPKPIVGSLGDIFSRMEDQPDERVKKEFFSTYEEIMAKMELLPPSKLEGTTLAKVWDVIFSSHSTFFRKYKEDRGDTKMEVYPWDVASDLSCGSRYYACKANVNGSRSTFIEPSRFAMARDLQANTAKLAVHYSAQTPDVMFGETFRAEAIMEFTEEPDGVSVRVYGGLKKVTGSFKLIRGIAEKEAGKQNKKAYATYYAQMRKALCGDTAALPPPTAPIAASPTETATVATPTSPAPSSLPLPIEQIALLIVCGLVLLFLFLNWFLSAGVPPGNVPFRTDLSEREETDELNALLTQLGASLRGGGNVGAPAPGAGAMGGGHEAEAATATATTSSGVNEVLRYRVGVLEEKVAFLEWWLFVVCLSSFLGLILAGLATVKALMG